MTTYLDINASIEIEGAVPSGTMKLYVVAFWGQEALSRPYLWRIRCAGNMDYVKAHFTQSPVGLAAKLTYVIQNDQTSGSHVEYLHGMIFEAVVVGSVQMDSSKWMLIDYVVRPPLYRLADTRNTQIYIGANDTTYPTEVAKGLLDPKTCRADTQTAGAYGSVAPLYEKDTTSSGSGSGSGSASASASGTTTSGSSGSGSSTKAHVFDIPGPTDIEQQARPMIVQYDESDLDFFSRLLEKEGIFYFFKQTSDQEKLVVSDQNRTFGKLTDTIALLDDQSKGASEGAKGFAYKYRLRFGHGPRAAYVRDYNWMAAAGTSGGSANDTCNFKNDAGVVTGDVSDSDTSAFRIWGAILHIDENVTTPEKTSADEENLGRTAKVRLQERRAFQNALELSTTSSMLRPGVEFTLTDDLHLLPPATGSKNNKYLVVSSQVRYVGTRAVDNDLLPDGEDKTVGFRNDVTCIDADIPFRPRQLTPRPKIAGILLARTDFANAQSGHSEIDPEYNRYTIRLLDEESTTARLASGKASPKIRQLQAYGGGETLTGTAFPLMDQTEIAIAFVHGDPDRPVIVGTLFDAAAKSVNQSGKTGSLKGTRLNRVMTSSGVVFEIYDGD